MANAENVEITAPKLFIPYSWSSPEHEKLVLDIVTELRNNMVDVIFDKWDFRERNDAYVFMEKMVTDPDIKKEALICDKSYAEKIDNKFKRNKWRKQSTTNQRVLLLMS